MPLVDLWTALVLVALIIALTILCLDILNNRYKHQKREMKQKHEVDKMLLDNKDD